MSREGLLVNAGEETIHVPEGQEKKPKTFKEKRKNFWYYHKGHVLVGIVLAALVGFFVYDMVTRVEPDYKVTMLAEGIYPQEQLELVQHCLETLSEDVNGDGKTLVQMANYPLTGEGQAEMTGQIQLMTDISVAETMVFFAQNKQMIVELQQQSGMFSYTDFSIPAEGAKDYENMYIPVSECKGLAGLGLNPDMVVGFRVFDPTSKWGKDTIQNYETSKVLFDRIVNG